MNMMARESVKPCGQSSNSLIRGVAMSMTFITAGTRYLKSSTSSAWTRATQTAASLPNGKRCLFFTPIVVFLHRTLTLKICFKCFISLERGLIMALVHNGFSEIRCLSKWTCLEPSYKLKVFELRYLFRLVGRVQRSGHYALNDRFFSRYVISVLLTLMLFSQLLMMGSLESLLSGSDSYYVCRLYVYFIWILLFVFF